MTVVLPAVKRTRVQPEIIPDEELVSGGVRLRRFTLDEYHKLIEYEIGIWRFISSH